MHAPITYNQFGDNRRSILEERPPRPPIIGKIRPGIKVLTKAARGNDKAVKLHDTLLAQGESFERIGEEIQRQTGIRNAMIPRNVGWFTCRRSDFTNPDVADEIMQRYGEDRGDGLKLWKFPVLFAFDDWLSNMPNQLAAWGASGRQFFSEYGPDGRRYCKMYAPVERDARASRAKRIFGGRTIILRQDDAIPDGLCDPHACPQYQNRQCNLSANFIFAVPAVKGLGLIELPTNSIYVLQKAYSAMQTVSLARGRLVGVQFFLSKTEVEISRIDPESGLPMRQKQMLTTLDAEIDIAALLDGGDHVPAVDMAREAVAALEAPLPPTESAERVEPPESGHSDAGAPAQQFADGYDDDPESQFEDLIARLGMADPESRAKLKTFALASFGKGWTKRSADVGRLIAEMRTALANPGAFREQVDAIAAAEATHA